MEVDSVPPADPVAPSAPATDPSSSRSTCEWRAGRHCPPLLQGAPEPQVREPGVPSGTNLLGLVKHVTAVERFVFLGEDAESRPNTSRSTAKDTVDSVLADYRAATERANGRILAYADLSQPAAASPGRGSSPTMRWR